MSTDGGRKRRLIRPGEIILLGIIVLILLSFGLQRCGFGVFKTTEDSEIIQKPHQGF